MGDSGLLYSYNGLYIYTYIYVYIYAYKFGHYELIHMTELVEREPQVWKIRSSIPCRVKPMTYKICTCRFLAWHLAFIRTEQELVGSVSVHHYLS